QGAVVNHRLAEIFSGGFAASTAHCDRASRAIILDYCGIADGDIGCALFEVCHGIAPRSHYLVNKRVSIIYGHGRVIDKTTLHGGPFLRKSIPRGWKKWLNGKTVDALFAIEKFKFGFRAISPVHDGAVVLRPEVLLQLLASALAGESQDDGGNYEQCD